MSAGTSEDRARPLRGRGDQCRQLVGLLDAVRQGQSGVLVLRGDPGIGKSALLDFAVTRASDLTVVRAGGIESEMELPFAALHQLCRPMLEHLDMLPPPQRAALGVAFGLESGPAPDRFFVGLAVLNLVSEQCANGPVVVAVDDAQWLDTASAQILMFVARRLQAEPVLMLFATREADALPELPDLVLRGLTEGDARALLDSVIWWPLDDQVRARIVDETHGNPLALLELPYDFSLPELPLATSDVGPLSVTSRIANSFLRRIQNLSDSSQLLMLLAAAEPVGDPQRVWRAAALLALSPSTADEARSAGLLDIGRRVVFRHPLVRSAVYGAASAADRRRVHQALAQISDPEGDADRRAWHRAQATPEADEEVAAELERSAGRAQGRGGVAAAAAFLERSTHLTPDPERRAQRALDAADATLAAGAFERTSALIAVAEAGPQDEVGRVRVDVARAKLAFATNHGHEAAQPLLSAARRLAGIDRGLARQVYVEAFAAARFAGRALPGGAAAVAAAAREAALSDNDEPTPSDLLLEALTEMFTTGYDAAVPIVRRALSAYRVEDPSPTDSLRALWLVSVLNADVWDDRAAMIIDARYLAMARKAGALVDLPLALDVRAVLHLFCGELDAAAALVDEKRVVCEATGTNLAPYGALALAAWRGQADVVARIVNDSLDEITARGEGAGITVLHYTRALLANGTSHFTQAVAAGKEAMLYSQEFAGANWAVAELIEAAARSGSPELARLHVDWLAPLAGASGTDWALGLYARCRALISCGPEADDLYREAIDRLQQTVVRTDLARAHLLYGEWLRRENRVLDARDQLRTANTMFGDAGIHGFAERARRELLAAGEKVRAPARAAAKYELTSQEEQISRLAVEGLTNAEIGDRLFISPRTVEWHLRKVFSKLGVTSRRGLREAISSPARLIGTAG